MSDAFKKLAHQLRLIQTSVNTASEMAAQILATEEHLFEQHLTQVLAEKELPLQSRELYRHIKRRLYLRHGYRPDEREIAAGLKQLGWEQHRISRGMRWMPPTYPAPSTPEPHDHEQQQDPPPHAAAKPTQ